MKIEKCKLQNVRRILRLTHLNSRATWGTRRKQPLKSLVATICNFHFSICNLRIVKSFSPNFQPKVAVSRQIRLRHRATIQLDRLRRLSSREERRGHRASRESRLVPG